MKMKILIIAHDFVPNTPRLTLYEDLANEFIRQGHTVSAITPDPSLDAPYVIDQFEHLKVYRFKSGRIKNVNRVLRAVNETLLSRTAWNVLKKELINDKHDLILYPSPSIFWGGLARRIKKTWNVPAILIIRDIFPQWVIDLGLIKSYSPIAYYFKHFEKKTYSAADVIAVQSPNNKQWMLDHHHLNKPIEVLYNWINENPIEVRETKYRQSLNLEEKVVFFYGGNMGAAQEMMNIVRLAKNLHNEPRAHFVLVGDGDESHLIQKTIKDQAIVNMTFLPLVSNQEHTDMLNEFDVGLISLDRRHTTHNLPGKLLKYMAMSKPIFGPVNPGNDLLTMIPDYKAGFVSVSGDDGDLAGKAKLLLSDETRRDCGKNSRKLLSSFFTAAIAADKIIEIYNDCSIGSNIQEKL